MLSPQHDFFTGNHTLVEGQLHDEDGRRIGHISAKSGDFIKSINLKISDHTEEISDVEAFFMEEAEIAILAYGSVSRSALEAVKCADFHIGLIKVNTIWPFPEKEVQRLAGQCRYVFVPEMNIGKYYREVERSLKSSKVVSLPKLGGEIHSPAELLEMIAREVGRNE